LVYDDRWLRVAVRFPVAGDAARFGHRTVAVVLPAHNEERHLADVVAAVPDWVDVIVVVDDASTDRTLEVARSLKEDRLVVIPRSQNGGVGAAVKTGYEYVVGIECDIVVKMDADGQMHAGDLAKIIRPLVADDAEYAKGNRFYVSGANASMPGLRKFGAVALSFMTKMASGYWHVFDSQCGFTAVKVSMLRLIDLSRVADDFFFENDMLIWMATVGARVVDVPIATLYGSEVSSMSLGRVVLSFPSRLLRGLVFRVVRRYLVVDLGAGAALGVSGTLLLFAGTVFGGYHWIQSFVTGKVASVGTVMLAVLPIMLGVQLLLQAWVAEVAASPGASQTGEYARRDPDAWDEDPSSVQ
jgi:dolichol-phosphate mannosyltransferase